MIRTKNTFSDHKQVENTIVAGLGWPWKNYRVHKKFNFVKIAKCLVLSLLAYLNTSNFFGGQLPSTSLKPNHLHKTNFCLSKSLISILKWEHVWMSCFLGSRHIFANETACPNVKSEPTYGFISHF